MTRVQKLVGFLVIAMALNASVGVQADLFNKLKKKAVKTLKNETERELENEVERQVRDIVPSFEEVETRQLDTSVAVVPVEGTVSVYTTSVCPHSQKAVQFMQENQISYIEYNIHDNPKGKADFRLLKGKGVPIILAGDQRMNGYSETALQSMLTKAGHIK